ncbi:hypothetical protein [Halovenus sp. HT40]|uniref:hypothetical protein n=1 Tax=Halovenus sp. HT40 TaxID=3126691 RepID=UPI00300F6157
MDSGVAVRFGVVVVLSITGLCVGAATATLGVDDTFQGDEDVAVTVDDDSVVVSDGDEQQVAVENMSWVQSVEISGQNGQYRIQTARERPFTSEQRSTAREIARTSDAVPINLTTYDLAIEPIPRLSADSAHSVEVSNITDSDGTFKTDGIAFGERSVTIDTGRSYVEEQLNVRVLGSDGEARASLVVDLTTGTVVDVTDFRTIDD